METHLTQRLKTIMTKPAAPEPVLRDEDFLSMGVTLMNLASYGRTHGGMVKGHIYRLVGRSSSGKTFLGRTILAEAAANPKFDEYELIYDDIERGALMDTVKFYGQRLQDRLVPPAWSTAKTPIYSRTVGDFFKRINKRLDAGKSFIWIPDSLDALESNEGRQTKMGDGKAKDYSQELRKLIRPIAETKSIVVLVSHAKVNMGSIFGGDYAPGGMAPEYYSTLEIWLSKLKTLKRTYNDKPYPIGTQVQATIKKNRISGPTQSVQFPIYKSCGIDDLGSCVDFLIGSKHWEKDKSGIEATEFDFTGSREKLITKIEQEDLQRELQVLTGKVWREIEAACSIQRKARYE